MDGSDSYLRWYLEWVRTEFPLGEGVVHPLGQPIVNAWAVAADAANISRPPPSYNPTIGLFKPRVHHASFRAYVEFMAHDLGQHGTGPRRGCNHSP
jgi:hypothetical protein